MCDTSASYILNYDWVIANPPGGGPPIVYTAPQTKSFSEWTDALFLTSAQLCEFMETYPTWFTETPTPGIVTSFEGRTGAVTSQLNDYNTDEIEDVAGLTGGPYANLSAALIYLESVLGHPAVTLSGETYIAFGAAQELVLAKITVAQLQATGTPDATKVLYGDGSWAVPPGASGGEANTGSNLGAGSQVFEGKTGIDLRFRTLTALAGITLNQTATTIEIGATAGTIDSSFLMVYDTNGALDIAGYVWVDVPFNITHTLSAADFTKLNDIEYRVDNDCTLMVSAQVTTESGNYNDIVEIKIQKNGSDIFHSYGWGFADNTLAPVSAQTPLVFVTCSANDIIKVQARANVGSVSQLILANGSSLSMAVINQGAGGGGGGSFTGLSDTPGSYVGQGTKYLRVNVAENAVEFVNAPSGASPLTTKGDIFTYDTGDARLPVGSDGEALLADSGETTGLIWGVVFQPGESGQYNALTVVQSVDGDVIPIEDASDSFNKKGVLTSIGDNGVSEAGNVVIRDQNGGIAGTSAGSRAAVTGVGQSTTVGGRFETGTGYGIEAFGLGAGSWGAYVHGILYGLRAEADANSSFAAYIRGFNGNSSVPLFVISPDTTNTSDLIQAHNDGGQVFHVNNDGSLDWDNAAAKGPTRTNLGLNALATMQATAQWNMVGRSSSGAGDFEEIEPNDLMDFIRQATRNRFDDEKFLISDNGDSSKLLAFECSAISTSTTRELSAADRDQDFDHFDTECWIIPISEIDTDIAVATGVGIPIRVPFNVTLTEVAGYLGTAPTGSSAIFDVNLNASTIMTTNKIEIDAGENDSDDATTAPTLTTTTANRGDVLTFDIDQKGSTVAGQNGTIYIYYQRR